jgi:hypothetical protein
MNGLFDKLRSAATSPLALGLLGGAAVGSPGFGLLMAPIIGAAQENAARDKTAAEQALEARALELERARRAEQGAQGLLAALSAPTVPDIMVGPPRPGVMRETDFRQSPQGLLYSAAQMNPAAVGETLLAQMTAQPEPPPNLRGTAGYLQQFLGRIPTPDEVIEFERRQAAVQPEDPRDALARAQLAQMQEQREAQAEASIRERATAEIDIGALLSSGESLLENIGKLEGSFLAPGGIGMDFRRGVASVGAELAPLLGRGDVSEELSGQIEALDKAKKDAADFVVNLAQATGANSATELNQIRESFAGLESSPAAIRAATVREMSRALARANALELDVPNRDRVERLLSQFQGAVPEAEQPEAQTFVFDPVTGEVRPKQ